MDIKASATIEYIPGFRQEVVVKLEKYGNLFYWTTTLETPDFLNVNFIINRVLKSHYYSFALNERFSFIEGDI